MRTPNILQWANSLPPGCAVIYRFKTYDADVAKELTAITRQNNQQLLFRQTKMTPLSDGLHFKRDTNLAVIRQVRADNPNALTTLAALKNGFYDEPLLGLDGLLVSSVFPSKSPSASSPIGVKILKEKVQGFDAPVFALGGVNEKTTSTLAGTGIAGIAVVGAFAKP